MAHPRSAALGAVVIAILSCADATPAAAQATAAQEQAREAAALASLPQDAAKRIFGRETTPTPPPARPIGTYTRGCLEGAVRLPAEGPNWEVMRPSRNRAWGHPALIAWIERLAHQAATLDGWPGLLVGDMAQPRGGPMLTDHGSHQIGIEADIWLMPMPSRLLTAQERDEIEAPSLVAANGEDVSPVWGPKYRRLIETAARAPGVARIFVNPAIKRALCREAGGQRDWLTKIRPWWGHKRHFHLRLACPRGERECDDQPPPPAGDGCGRQLAWWFRPGVLHPHPGPPPRPLRLENLPAPCAGLVAAR